jgi:hypothetical protein
MKKAKFWGITQSTEPGEQKGWDTLGSGQKIQLWIDYSTLPAKVLLEAAAGRRKYFR